MSRKPIHGKSHPKGDKKLLPPQRPEGFENRCGARKGPNHTCSEKCKARGCLCFNKSHFPGTSIGGGRCKHHGALATGAKTPEGKRETATHGITHGLNAKFKTWEEYRRSKYSQQELDVIDQIPTTPDLAPEIQAVRMKIEHLERNRIIALRKAEQYEAAKTDRIMNEVAPGGAVTPDMFGLTRNSVTGDLCHNGVSIQRWVEVETMARDSLRKILQAQKDINPAGRAKGNLQLNIQISGQAQVEADKEEVPELHEDVATVPEGEQPAEAATPAEPRKDDDIPD